MARSVVEYKNQLIALLPRGDAWHVRSGDDLDKILTGVAEELTRIDGDVGVALKELFAGSVTQWIDEWEKDWGLPGDCLCKNPPETVTERRNILVNKKIGISNQSRDTYIRRAAQLGFAVTITEYKAGDAVPGHPEISSADAAVVIQVNAALNNLRPRKYGSLYGEPYATWSNGLLECSLKEITQSHRLLIFSYT